MDAAVEQVDLRFFDYRADATPAPIRLSVDRQVLQVDALRLVGDDTELDLAGIGRPADAGAGAAGQRRRQPRRAAGLRARRPQLGPRRGVGPHRGHRRGADRLGQRAARPTAACGTSRSPTRSRPLNGIVTFDATGVRVDGVTARLGGGPVQFGGRVGLSGYVLSEFDVTAVGEDMRLRYPEGMRSLVDADARAARPDDARRC